ncbi:hypothetical protein OG429_00545 [Streptomyces sp. NBC_00190]|nr:hypothetical protein [Streptomyces sp. NBC_00190]
MFDDATLAVLAELPVKGGAADSELGGDLLGDRAVLDVGDTGSELPGFAAVAFGNSMSEIASDDSWSYLPNDLPPKSATCLQRRDRPTTGPGSTAGADAVTFPPTRRAASGPGAVRTADRLEVTVRVVGAQEEQLRPVFRRCRAQ